MLGSWDLLTQPGRAPRRLIWDNESGTGRGNLTESAAVFPGTLAPRIVLLGPRDLGSKAVVERRNGLFQPSFIPAAVASPADFNAQSSQWLATANAGAVRTLKTRPVVLLEADKDAMLPLLPAVLHLGWRNHVRLGRDYSVRVDTNDDSVHPARSAPGSARVPTREHTS